MVLKLTIVRHGESIDNLKSSWAGSRDAPLSTHGMNQAKALGKHFAKVHIDAIYASPLLRARWTAEQIQSQNLTDPRPEITFSKLLQEQHFGDAEGKSWAGNGKEHGYVRESGRTFAFPNGETLNDVGKRADEALDRFILPHLHALLESSEEKDLHVVIAAHGIFNSELLGALLRRRKDTSSESIGGWRYEGMSNTGWTRVLIEHADGPTLPSSTSSSSSTPPRNPSAIPATSAPISPSSQSYTKSSLKLKISIPVSNQTTHLDGLARQKGGVGSTAFDPRQASIKQFFGGGSL